jgi:hypothetical protein
MQMAINAGGNQIQLGNLNAATLINQVRARAAPSARW